MRKFLVPILIFFISLKGKTQDSLSNQFLLGGRLEILVPSSMHKMTQEEFQYKYPDQNQKVSFILTDSNLSTNILINHMTEYNLSNDSVYQFKDIQIKKIKAKFPTAKFLEDCSIEINGLKIGLFKVITPAENDAVFNYFYITSLQGKVLIVNFNCVATKMDEWHILADKIFSSLKLHQ